VTIQKPCCRRGTYQINSRKYGDAIISSDGTLAMILLSRLHMSGCTGGACLQEVVNKGLQKAHGIDIRQLKDAGEAGLLKGVSIQFNEDGNQDYWNIGSIPKMRQLSSFPEYFIL
jgi:hypothetical protein